MSSQHTTRTGSPNRRPAAGWLGVGMAALAFGQMSCGGASPTGPTSGSLSTMAAGDDSLASGFAATSDSASAVPVVTAQNATPNLVLRTQPPATPGNPYSLITGKAPLEVKFNLCKSDDPDQPGDSGEDGDSLNWQFHFGDDGSEPFNPDGSFNANFARVCRTSHTYAEGSYIATVSVTDKHLEDQGRDVSGLARVVEQVAIVVSGSGGTSTSFKDASSLTTLFATNNSYAGNTFDLQSSVPLQITGFDVNLSASGGTHTVAVYYRTGTANGAESSAAGWSLLGKDTAVVSSGTNSPSTVNVGGLTLNPGTIYGFYVDVESYPSASMLYTNGGPAVFSNGDLSLTTYHGKGNPAFSGGTFFPRQWNGTVHYVK
jgi:hypothetical protein